MTVSGSGGSGSWSIMGSGYGGAMQPPTKGYHKGIPSYFDLSKLSPIAANFLRQLFPEAEIYGEDLMAGENPAQMGLGTAQPFTPAGVGRGAIVPTKLPEQMSAQTQQGMKASGIYGLFESYLDLFGPEAKQSWLDQAMAGFPSAQTTKPARYQTTRQK